MKSASYCALHLRARAEHINKHQCLHTTIHNLYITLMASPVCEVLQEVLQYTVKTLAPIETLLHWPLLDTIGSLASVHDFYSLFGPYLGRVREGKFGNYDYVSHPPLQTCPQNQCFFVFFLIPPPFPYPNKCRNSMEFRLSAKKSFGAAPICTEFYFLRTIAWSSLRKSAAWRKMSSNSSCHE